MDKIRKSFDRNFKLKAVELSYERDNIKVLANELGIRVELLYRWCAEFSSGPETSFPGNGKTIRNEEENGIAQLKKELAEMRLERNILKKAIGIFSKSDGKSFNS